MLRRRLLLRAGSCFGKTARLVATRLSSRSVHALHGPMPRQQQQQHRRMSCLVLTKARARTRPSLNPRCSKAHLKVPVRSVYIQVEETPNPDSLKFFPAIKMLPTGTTRDFASARDALASPLAADLFGLDGVTGVFLSEFFVTVNKAPEVSWAELKPEIFETMMEFFSSGKPLLDPSAASAASSPDTEIHEDDDETVAMIKEILETRVRPSVQQDGGDIKFERFENGIVYLRLQGSCSGCPSSGITLKNGIERLLMHWVAEVEGVEEAPDPQSEEMLKRIPPDA